MSPISLDDLKAMDTTDYSEARRIARKKLGRSWHLKEYWLIYRDNRAAGNTKTDSKRQARVLSSIRYKRMLRFETRMEIRRMNNERMDGKNK